MSGRTGRALRYLAPNLVTAASLVFGMLSLLACFEGRFVDAAWLIVYAVLADRMDGFVARLLKGTSELGVQLDSLADFLNFGVAPAVLVYTSLSSIPALPFGEGGARVALLLACAAWIFGATFRLARYNVVGTESDIFFGVPTTLAAGLLVMWYLALLKYAPAEHPYYGSAGDEFRIFGSLTTPMGVWRWMPAVMFVGAFLMASNVRMPKLGITRSRLATGFVLGNVAAGYILGLLRMFPDYLVWPPTLWLVVFLVWGQLSAESRSIKPPPMFPRRA